MKLPASFALLGLLWAAPAQAQTVCEVACEVNQEQPFVVFTEAEDVAGTTYVVTINGARSPLQARVVNGHVEFAFLSGLSRGTYIFAIEAYGAAGLTWRSEPNTLTVQPGKRTTKVRKA